MKYTIEAIRKPNSFIKRMSKNVKSITMTSSEKIARWMSKDTAEKNLKLIDKVYPNCFKLTDAKSIFGYDWNQYV